MLTFIGDIHGGYQQLESILEQEPEGPYIFLGDLIDRGPDSRQVVKKVRQLCEENRAQCLLGNHEYALVRALGCEEKNINPTPDLFDIWLKNYGGKASCESYGVTNYNLEIFKQTLADDLVWMAELPWILSNIDNPEQENKYIAVHAGLQAHIPWKNQLKFLQNSALCWDSGHSSYPVHCLYMHDKVDAVPNDLPEHTHVISGHICQKKAYVSKQRILCDTRGHDINNPVSAVRWPENKIFVSK